MFTIIQNYIYRHHHTEVKSGAMAFGRFFRSGSAAFPKIFAEICGKGLDEVILNPNEQTKDKSVCSGWPPGENNG